jgi:ribosomal protein L11 methylase PrmA
MLQPEETRRPLVDYLGPGGRLLLSGIIDRQEAEVIQALEIAGASVQETLRVRDWVSLVAQRR